MVRIKAYICVTKLTTCTMTRRMVGLMMLDSLEKSTYILWICPRVLLWTVRRPYHLLSRWAVASDVSKCRSTSGLAADALMSGSLMDFLKLRRTLWRHRADTGCTTVGNCDRRCSGRCLVHHRTPGAEQHMYVDFLKCQVSLVSVTFHHKTYPAFNPLPSPPDAIYSRLQICQ